MGRAPKALNEFNEYAPEVIRHNAYAGRHLQLIEAVMATVRQGTRKLTGAGGSTIVLKQGDEVFYADEDAIEPLWKGQRFAAGSWISGWSFICMDDSKQCKG